MFNFKEYVDDNSWLKIVILGRVTMQIDFHFHLAKRCAVMWHTLLVLCVILASGVVTPVVAEAGASAPRVAPEQELAPMAGADHPVDWWFAFKFNTKVFPGCGDNAVRACPFGGDLQQYKFGQQYVSASSSTSDLKKGGGCLGGADSDPVGATYERIYSGAYYFVVWNDLFYDDPQIKGCKQDCGGPWGHSDSCRDDTGAGLVMQVSTPSWPAAGSNKFPRSSDGNTLTCVHDDNVLVSQHFFAVRLSKDDVVRSPLVETPILA
ncbi:MAG: hypothetical protein V4508_19435 [Pseudomonadota bacterium]